MFEIEFLPPALEDLRGLRPFDRNRLIEAIEVRLRHEPIHPTRHRKRLRPNRLAEWELRVESFRIFYEVDRGRGVVTIVAIGIKLGQHLYIRGERFEL